MVFLNDIHKSPTGRLYRIYLHRLENEPRQGKAALTWNDCIEPQKTPDSQGYHKNASRVYFDLSREDMGVKVDSKLLIENR